MFNTMALLAGGGNAFGSKNSFSIKVQKDHRVSKHLQAQPTENLNLLFYDFNKQTALADTGSGSLMSPSTASSTLHHRRNITQVFSSAVRQRGIRDCGQGGDRVPTRGRTA